MPEIINEEEINAYIEEVRDTFELGAIGTVLLGWPKPFVACRDAAVADAPSPLKQLVCLWWTLRERAHEVGLNTDEGQRLACQGEAVRRKTEALIEQAWPGARLRSNGKIVRLIPSAGSVPTLVSDGPDSS